MSHYRNRKKERIKKRADNRFTAITGFIVTRLTGSCDCWIVHQQEFNRQPVKKIAYAALNGWQEYEMESGAKRMSHLRVKQSCKVDQCVNPEHLVGTELTPTI